VHVVEGPHGNGLGKGGSSERVGDLWLLRWLWERQHCVLLVSVSPVWWREGGGKRCLNTPPALDTEDLVPYRLIHSKRNARRKCPPVSFAPSMKTSDRAGGPTWRSSESASKSGGTNLPNLEQIYLQPTLRCKVVERRGCLPWLGRAHRVLGAVEAVKGSDGEPSRGRAASSHP
jgi:hypothetical protein